MVLNSFSALLPLVAEQLQFRQADTRLSDMRLADTRLVELYALKGELLWRSGKTTQADEAWQRGLAAAPKRDSTYFKVAAAQVRNRAFDGAIATLLKARSELNLPAAFCDDLSQLYGAVGNYTAGAQEVLTLLKTQGNYNAAVGRISAYLVNEKGTAQTRAVLEKAAYAEPNSVMMQRVYSQFLRDTKNYDAAFDVITRIDNLLNAQGRELLQFADLARREKSYAAALKGYDVIISKGKKNPFAMSALLGYARTAESRLAETNSFTQIELKNTLERYAQIVSDYPQSPQAAEAQYRIAVLTLEQANNPQKAIADFTVLMERYRNYPIAAQGAVELGNTYVALQQLDKAEETFKRTAQMFPQQPNERDEALFHLAELEYFRCALDSAQAHFGKLAVNTNADIANDALEMLSILDFQQSPIGKAALCTFAAADLLMRQKQPDVAIEKYKTVAAGIAANAQPAPLAELSLLKAGKIERSRKRCEAAQQLFLQLITKYPESGYGDQALLYTAECLAEQGRKDDAIQTYSQILVKYPRSTYLQEARARIRKLRGDA